MTGKKWLVPSAFLLLATFVALWVGEMIKFEPRGSVLILSFAPTMNDLMSALLLAPLFTALLLTIAWFKNQSDSSTQLKG